MNLSAKKILEKFGASNYTKAKINDIQYVIFINKKNKAIHITYDNTEFTINFPPIDIKNQDSIPEKKETTSDMQGDKKNGATSSANGSPSLGMKSQQQESLKNEMEEKGDKIEFQSIPILIKSPLKKIKTTENNEELEMNNNV